jgi:hypothetical protein
MMSFRLAMHAISEYLPAGHGNVPRICELQNESNKLNGWNILHEGAYLPYP